MLKDNPKKDAEADLMLYRPYNEQT